MAKDTVEVQILAETKQALKNLAKFTAAIGAAVIAVKGVARAVSGSLEAYQTQEKAVAKLNSALKATGGTLGFTSTELQKMAAEMSNLTAIADETIIEGQALMTTFTQIGKEVFPDALMAAQDMSVMFGQDLQQSVIQLGTALNDPIAGVGRLKRIGVSFTDTQRESIKAFVEQNDIMSAQNVILDELQKEFGGVAEAMGGTTLGAMERLKNSMGDIREVFGQGLAEALAPAANAIAAWANENRDKIQAIVVNFPDIVKLVFRRALDVMKDMMSFDNLKVVFGSIGEALIKTLWEAIKQIPKMFVARLKFITEPFAALGRYLMDVFRNAFDNFVNFGVDAINSLLDRFKLSGLAEALGLEGGQLQRRVVRPITSIGDRWDEMVGNMGDSGKEFLDGFIQVARTAGAEFGDAFGDISDALADPEFRAAMDALLQPIGGTDSFLGMLSQGGGAIEESAGAVEEFAASVDNATSRMERMRSVQMQVNEAEIDMIRNSEDLLDITDQLSDGFARAMESIGASLVTGQDAFKALGAIALETIAAILEAMGKKMLADAIADAVMVTINPALGIAGAAAAFAAAGIVRALAGNITAMADGGIVTRPTMALIGEAGPEAVVPLGRGGGGMGDTIVLNVQGSVVTREELFREVEDWRRQRARSY